MIAGGCILFMGVPRPGFSALPRFLLSTPTQEQCTDRITPRSSWFALLVIMVRSRKQGQECPPEFIGPPCGSQIIANICLEWISQSDFWIRSPFTQHFRHGRPTSWSISNGLATLPECEPSRLARRERNYGCGICSTARFLAGSLHS